MSPSQSSRLLSSMLILYYYWQTRKSDGIVLLRLRIRKLGVARELAPREDGDRLDLRTGQRSGEEDAPVFRRIR